MGAGLTDWKKHITESQVTPVISYIMSHITSHHHIQGWPAAAFSSFGCAAPGSGAQNWSKEVDFRPDPFSSPLPLPLHKVWDLFNLGSVACSKCASWRKLEATGSLALTVSITFRFQSTQRLKIVGISLSIVYSYTVGVWVGVGMIEIGIIESLESLASLALVLSL